MGLEREDDVADIGAVALQGSVEPLGLDREGAGVVVRLAVDQQDRLIDPVGEGEGRHLRIGVAGLPVGALLGLEAERGQGAVVGARTGDAGAEQVSVGQQVGGHEGPVAVPADGDPVAVGHAHFHHRIHRCLGAGGQLLDVGVVGFGPVDADDRHRRIVQHGIALGQQEEVADAARPGEAVGGVDHLAGHGGVGELGRIGPHHQRQRSVAILVVAGGQIERARQLDPVGAGVADQLLGHPGHLRGRVREGGQGRRLGVEVADEEVGRIVAGLASRHHSATVLIEDAHHSLIGTVFRRPDPLGRAGGQVHGRQEGIFPCPRRPGAGHQHPGAVGGELHHREAAGVGLGQREAGIVVAILIVPLQQDAALAGVGGVDQIAGLAPAVELPADHQRGVCVTPDHAAVAVLEVDQRGRRGVERRLEGEDPVADLGGAARIAAILGLDPDQGRGGVGPPLGRPRAGSHGVERGRNVVAQRQVGDPVHDHALHVRHQNIGREQGRRDHVAVGPPHPRLQDIAPIGRDARTQKDGRGTQGPRLPGQRNQRQLGGEIVFEQGLVAGVGQQVLIGPGGGGTTQAFLDDRTLGRTADVRGRAAARRGHPDQKARAVRQPVEGTAARGIDPGVRQFARHTAGHVHGPELQPGRRIHQQGHRAAVRRPAGREEA